MTTAVRNAVRGLSTEDLKTIRDSLAAGRKPKVVFTDAAGQMAGQAGQVVRLTDPDLSDEWVVVRFGRDELPFSPTDLQIPARGSAGRRPEPPAARAPSTAGEASTARHASTARDPSTARDASTARQPASVGDRPAARQDRDRPAARPDTPAPAATTVDRPGPAAAGEAPPARKPTAGKGAKGPKGRPLPTLTVTLAYAGGEWTVAAQQGARALAKPYLIKPSEALKMVGLLDVPGVQEAVEHILATERADAEQQAQRLRAELAEIEARLAELRVSG